MILQGIMPTSQKDSSLVVVRTRLAAPRKIIGLGVRFNSTTMPTTGFRINEPDVIYQLFTDETVAIHLATGAYHSLPGIAGEAFLCLAPAGASVRDVAAQLASRYEAQVETIEEDLGRFFTKLEQESLVVRVDLNGRSASAQKPQPIDQRAAYQAPNLHTHTDLQELFLIDPIHDVSAAGWPNLQPELDPAVSSEAASQQGFRISGPHVIFETMGDETVIMNLETGAYYSVIGAAEDVFRLFEQTPTFAELRSALSSKYAVDTAELEPALQTFLTALTDAGLIARQPESGQAPRTLELARPGTGLPFSPMRLTSFQEAASAASGAPPQPGRIVRFRVRRNDLLMASASGEMVVADRQSGDYYRLNQPAVDVFSLLAEQPLRVEHLVAALLRKYDIPDRQMTGAVMILLRNLAAMNLVVMEAVEPEEQPLDPELSAPSSKIPFAGFHCEIYKDLRELMSPFNVQRPTVHSRASSAAFFLNAMGEYFVEAWKPGAERSLKVAGCNVRLQSADPLFTDDLTKALAHLAAGPAPADLTIHIWDASTPPRDPFFSLILERLFGNWGESCGPRGELLGIHGEDASAIYHPGPDILSVVDRKNGRAFFLKKDLSPLPYWEIGSPFRYIFHSWFADRGLQFVHGGAVGTPAGGVLLTGKGGSGKSTTTMLCAKAGMQFAGDDYCLADPRSGYLHGLYNTSKLKSTEDLTRLPEVAGLSRNVDSFENGGFGKGIYFLSDVWKDRLSSGFPLRAILIPSVTGSVGSRLDPCSPADALMAMMPSTVAQLPAACQSDSARIAALAEKLPAYHFYLGTDVAQIPPLVQEVLSR